MSDNSAVHINRDYPDFIYGYAVLWTITLSYSTQPLFYDGGHTWRGSECAGFILKPISKFEI